MSTQSALSAVLRRAAVMAGIAFLPVTATMAQVDQSVIDANFHTYKNGGPKLPGVTAGVTLTKDNVDAARDALPPALYNFIKKGDTTLGVAETLDFTLHEKYIEATRKNAAVSFDAKGNLANYVNGRPFPKENAMPDKNDPNLAVKLAWNYQYGRVWGDLGCVDPFIWDFKDYNTGKVERSIEFDVFCLKRYSYKTTDDPIPDRHLESIGPDRIVRVRHK